MSELKQMCWCFKVFFRVFGNLTSRLVTDLMDGFYEMCAFCCCCCCSCTRGTIKLDEESVKEPAEEFYKAVSRHAAETLLKNKQNGTFIIRPSKNSNLGTLSVIQDEKVFHLNIRRRNDDFVALGNAKSNEKCFRDLDSLINYYISNYLVLYSEGEKSLTLLLPYREAKRPYDMVV